MELKVDDKSINYMKVENEDYISIRDMENSSYPAGLETEILHNTN